MFRFGSPAIKIEIFKKKEFTGGMLLQEEIYSDVYIWSAFNVKYVSDNK